MEVTAPCVREWPVLIRGPSRPFSSWNGKLGAVVQQLNRIVASSSAFQLGLHFVQTYISCLKLPKQGQFPFCRLKRSVVNQGQNESNRFLAEDRVT